MKKSELASTININSNNPAQGFTCIAAIQKQWEECDAHVEDVMDGICVTLLLPFVRDLKTRALSGNRIELEAYRVVGAAEEKTGSSSHKMLLLLLLA